ncbi:putative universal stress protein A [Rosa chinensis]|uniref:Putative universal stress protein A n=1 Tax=Rosa chinensis TaxID=74649 RepID=A0A2P6RD09_ROSCH|nr:universal stress protein YxiE [Rosa chinensis]PRQ44300.1 putative universal stress protein A [Rosa chinensis]
METTYAAPGTTVQTTPLVHVGDEGLRRTKMRVMVAIDESDSSFYALNWALDHLFINAPSTLEGGEGEGGMVTVVHVTQPFQHFVYPAGPAGATYYASASVVESVKKAQQENSAAILSRAMQICKDRMIKAETLTLTGDPKDMICQATEQMHVDLLVVGSRGLGMVKRAFLGSVSDYCAHHASCPVMIVKPPRGSGAKGSASSKK